MGDIGSISIDRMIVHKLDHLQATQPQLSDLVSPVTDEASKFISKHITNNCEHRRARRALFAEPSSNQVRIACDTVLDQVVNEAVFIDQSRVIATLLFAAMRGNRRISTGDLLMCLYSDVDNANQSSLAILKLDLESGFVGRVTTEGTKTRVVLEQIEDVLTNSELQKCAFVLPPDLRAAYGYDLTVLDQQTGRFNTNRHVASFFLQNFLNCTVGHNCADLTQTFVYASCGWIDEKEAWSGPDILRFKERIYQAVDGEAVDVLAFADEVIPDLTEREEFVEHLRTNGLRELTFPPDPGERTRLANFVTYEGDNGLRIRVRREALGENRTVSPVRNQDGTWTVTVRTSTWRSALPGGR